MESKGLSLQWLPPYCGQGGIMNNSSLGGLIRTTVFLCLTLSLSDHVRANTLDCNRENYSIDKTTGLIKAPGWQLVLGNCSACHSTQLITQNHGTKAEWKNTIQWMINTQGLWDSSDAWEPILNYLSQCYPQEEIDMSIFRRRPLAILNQPK